MRHATAAEGRFYTYAIMMDTKVRRVLSAEGASYTSLGQRPRKMLQKK